MINDLDDLKIVGVRPKPREIRGDLTIKRRVLQEPAVQGSISAAAGFGTGAERLTSSKSRKADEPGHA